MSRLDLSGTFKRDVKSVSLFGFGRSAAALIPHLLESGYTVTVRDDRVKIKDSLPKDVRIFLGASATKSIDEDVMIIAPSVRRERFLRAELPRRIILTSDTEIFFKAFRGKSFAISGSSGKSTSTTLLYEILSTTGKTHLLGNIGVPMTDALMRGNIARAVCEISSFNLQYDEIKPYRASITNIKRNHLNWHKDFREYIEAKYRLLSSSLWFSVNLDDDLTRDLAFNTSCYACFSLKSDYNCLHKVHKDKIIFTLTSNGIMRNDDLIIPRSAFDGYAEYNIYNLLTALTLAEGEYDKEALPEVVKSHRALSHRCEEFLSAFGVRFIDSSIDTSPDRTSETLSALSGNIILLLGGRSKGESYSSLLPIIEKKCKSVIAFGEARDKIASDLCGGDVSVTARKTMREAALLGLSRAVAGDTLLLSPASTSFDEFSSFEERGDIFKKIVKDAVRQENTGDKNEKDN